MKNLSGVIRSLLIVTLIALSFPSATHGAECGPAKIELGAGGQNWNVTYCISSDNKKELESVQSISSTCRRASATLFDENVSNCVCHDDDWYTRAESAIGSLVCGLDRPPPKTTTQHVPFPKVTQGLSGKFGTCFTLENIDRNAGVLETKILNSDGKVVCQPERTNVTPGNYGWQEYLQNTQFTRKLPFATTPFDASSQFFCVDGKKVNTAFGCIDATPQGLFTVFFRIGIGIAGGIAFLLIMFGGFQIMTSAGNPEQLNEGKELVSSAIAGLLMVIFSVFLLQVIGVQILCIPGFGASGIRC